MRQFSLLKAPYHSLVSRELYVDVARRWGANALGYLLLYPAVVLAAFCYHLVQALLYALLGLLIAGFLKCRLGYSAVLRVAIVALTPALLLKTMLSTVGVEFPFAGFLYFLVAMGYLAFGLAANRENPRLEGGQVPGGVAG